MNVRVNRRRGLTRTSRRRLYYGGYVVGVCHLVAWMTWGIGVFTQGVFLGFFMHTYGWSRTTLSFGPTLFYLWAGVLGVLIGHLIDRYGPRPVLVGGAMLLGGARAWPHPAPMAALSRVPLIGHGLCLPAHRHSRRHHYPVVREGAGAGDGRGDLRWQPRRHGPLAAQRCAP